MSGILATPKTATRPITRQRLAAAREPVDRFFESVPEAKAFLFVVHSLNPLYDAGCMTPAWVSVMPKRHVDLDRLEKDDRYPAAAWRLQSAPATNGIASIVLAEMPNGHERPSCLLALPGYFYWVPDSTILYLLTQALGSYPKFPIAPLFPDEPGGHDALGSCHAFEENFPEVATAIRMTWGTNPIKD